MSQIPAPACDCCTKGPKAFDADFRAKLAKYGFTVIGVTDGPASFAYTVGLHDHGFPELAMHWPDVRAAGMLLDAQARDVLESGTAPYDGQVIDTGPGRPVFYLRTVDAAPYHVARQRSPLVQMLLMYRNWTPA